MQGSGGENMEENQVGSHRVRMEQFAKFYLVDLDIEKCGNRAISLAIQ